VQSQVPFADRKLRTLTKALLHLEMGGPVEATIRKCHMPEAGHISVKAQVDLPAVDGSWRMISVGIRPMRRRPAIGTSSLGIETHKEAIHSRVKYRI
jgi:hypothetical protein